CGGDGHSGGNRQLSRPARRGPDRGGARRIPRAQAHSGRERLDWSRGGLMTTDTAAGKTIVALDLDSAREALALVDALDGHTGMFKVGHQLFVAEGPAIVRSIVSAGKRVFLDLKFHDIPNTVSEAAREAGKLGVTMFTLHASGGPEMIEAARRTLAAEFGERRPLIAAVTVLTSMNAAHLRQTGVADAPADHALRLGRMARESGADALVCSPDEIRLFRRALGDGVKLVCPGVRMAGQSLDDQKRTSTPREAIDAGADWIVV